MPSNLKKMVRRRMAETGESWQTALRHVREWEKFDKMLDRGLKDRLTQVEPKTKKGE